MGTLVNLSINVAKIDKSKLIEGKDGAKYLNLTVSLNDTKDQYGNDAACWVQQSKDERILKVPRTYLGNGKVMFRDGGGQPPATGTDLAF